MESSTNSVNTSKHRRSILGLFAVLGVTLIVAAVLAAVLLTGGSGSNSTSESGGDGASTDDIGTTKDGNTDGAITGDTGAVTDDNTDGVNTGDGGGAVTDGNTDGANTGDGGGTVTEGNTDGANTGDGGGDGGGTTDGANTGDGGGDGSSETSSRVFYVNTLLTNGQKIALLTFWFLFLIWYIYIAHVIYFGTEKFHTGDMTQKKHEILHNIAKLPIEKLPEEYEIVNPKLYDKYVAWHQRVKDYAKKTKL